MFETCKTRSGTHGLFEELGRHVKGVGLRNVLIVGLVMSALSMFFLSVHHMIPRDKILGNILTKSLLWKHVKLSITAAFLIRLCFVYVKNKVC